MLQELSNSFDRLGRGLLKSSRIRYVGKETQVGGKWSTIPLIWELKVHHSRYTTPKPPALPSNQYFEGLSDYCWFKTRKTCGAAAWNFNEHPCQASIVPRVPEVSTCRWLLSASSTSVLKKTKNMSKMTLTHEAAGLLRLTLKPDTVSESWNLSNQSPEDSRLCSRSWQVEALFHMASIQTKLLVQTCLLLIKSQKQNLQVYRFNAYFSTPQRKSRNASLFATKCTQKQCETNCNFKISPWGFGSLKFRKCAPIHSVGN